MLARRRKELAESTRRTYQRRLDRDLNAILVLAPTNRHGKRLRKRYGKVRGHLFTFLEYPDVPPDNNGGERELRPTATYRKSLPPRTRGSPAASDRTGVPTCSPPSDLSSALRRDAASMHTKPFSPFCAADQCSRRVEQIPARLRARLNPQSADRTDERKK